MATITRRPTGNGNYSDWTPSVEAANYEMVDEVTPDDDTSYNTGSTQGHRDSFTFPFTGDDAVPSGATNIAVTVKWRAKKIGALTTFKLKPFLRFSSTDNDGTEITETTSYADHSEQLTKPGGGSWTVAEINSVNWEAGYLLSTLSGGGGPEGRVTQLYVEISYDAAASDEPPTSLQCDRATNPTGVGDTPIFTALYQADGDSGTADRYKIEVSEASDFSSFKWQSGEQTLSPTCTDNQRCTEIAYGGTSLKSDVTYYWRIQLYQSGRTGTWSTVTATFSGIDRDWEDAEYPVRRKLTVNADHDGIASGELLSFDFETGKRIILASDGCFDEAIQASGGFSIARHAGRTHVAYLSRLESVGAMLGIRVVSINHITGERGTSHYIDSSGTTYDTHYFPTIDVTPDGYIHCFYGAHGGSYKYRRSKYPNESGSLSTDHTDAAMWVRPDTGADAYMTITGFTGTYAIPFHIASGDDAGRLYCFCRSGTSYRYIFVYSDNSGVSWSAVHTMIDDTSASRYRVYMYGVRFDRKNQRLHISWTHNFTGDVEQGIWYAYCDYDETDGSSLDVGFNIFRWADGTLAGRTKTTGAQAPIDYTVAKAITTSSAELSKVFTETLVIDKNGDPVVFWEQKFNQGTNLWAHQTNLMCARWSGSAWVIYCISDQVNTKLRVRRSSVAIGLDRDGVIHAVMPVASKTQWRQLATGDDDNVGVTRASGTVNYAMIDDGLTRIDQATWLKMSAVGSKASFTHGTSNADDIKKIFSVEVVAFAKSTGSASAVKLYIDNGTTTNLGSSQAVSTSAITRYTAEWTTNPFTSVAWAAGDIAGLRFGVQCDSTNEVQVFSVFMRFTFMRSTDENLGAVELHELTSSDNGVTWQIQERSRNSMVGVPMMSHPHHLAGDVFEAVWTSGHDIFYYSNERFGLMLPTGVDVRILHGATEVDRVATYWNLNKSRISFKAQEAITAGKTAGASDYYIEYGNRNVSNQPQGAPGDVWQGFWNFEEMAEGAGLGTHADWTVNQGAASVYSGLTNHRNKVYAGNHAIKTTTHPFGASTLIGTDLTDVFIECGIWMEGGSSYSYIEAHDVTGGIGFRVGVNATTNRPAYYDGSWHDVTSAGFADRANMNAFAILVTASGCSAWVNGIRICHEVTRITVVDYILISAASESYFDLIRWSKRPYTTKDYTITTGFDKATALYSTDYTATKEANDAYHNIPTTPWQKSRITRLDVTVDVRNASTEETDFSISTYCWLGNTSPYDSTDTERFGVHLHTGINGGVTWQGSYTYSFASLNMGQKSVKIDCKATTCTDSPETSQARITQIKIWTEDRDPIIVIGDEEWRGFRMDATLQGSGQIQFFMDANLDAVFMRTQQAGAIATNRSASSTSRTGTSHLQSPTGRAAVVIDHSAREEIAHLWSAASSSKQKASANMSIDNSAITHAIVAAPVQWNGMFKTGAGIPLPLSWRGAISIQSLDGVTTNKTVAAKQGLIVGFNGTVEVDSMHVLAWIRQQQMLMGFCVAAIETVKAAAITAFDMAESIAAGTRSPLQLVQMIQAAATMPSSCSESMTAIPLGPFPISWDAVVDTGGRLSIGHIHGVSAAALFATDVRGGVEIDLLTPVEVLQGIAELLCRVTVSTVTKALSGTGLVISIDKGLAAGARLQIAMLQERLGRVSLPSEWTQETQVDVSARSPMSWCEGATPQADLGDDWSETVAAVAHLPLSSSDQMSVRMTSPAQWPQTVKLDGLLHLPESWGRGVSAKNRLSIEWAEMTRVDLLTQLPMSWLAAALMQTGVPVDWSQLSHVEALTRLSLSWSSLLLAQNETPIDLRHKIEVRSGSLIIDWGMSTRLEQTLPASLAEQLSAAFNFTAGWLGELRAKALVTIGYTGQTATSINAQIDFGEGVSVGAVVSIERLQSLMADLNLPEHWTGIALTMILISDARLQLPGAVGATLRLPQIAGELLQLAGAKETKLKLPGPEAAALELVKILNAMMRGG